MCPCRPLVPPSTRRRRRRGGKFGLSALATPVAQPQRSAAATRTATLRSVGVEAAALEGVHRFSLFCLRLCPSSCVPVSALRERRKQPTTHRSATVTVVHTAQGAGAGQHGHTEEGKGRKGEKENMRTRRLSPSHPSPVLGESQRRRGRRCPFILWPACPQDAQTTERGVEGTYCGTEAPDAVSVRVAALSVPFPRPSVPLAVPAVSCSTASSPQSHAQCTPATSMLAGEGKDPGVEAR